MASGTVNDNAVNLFVIGSCVNGSAIARDAPGSSLSGGNFPVSFAGGLIEMLKTDCPFLDDFRARRLMKAYGMDASNLIGVANSADELGQRFGATLTAREVDWLIDMEFARTAEDVVWFRSKIGLCLTGSQIEALEAHMASRRTSDRANQNPSVQRTEKQPVDRDNGTAPL